MLDTYQPIDVRAKVTALFGDLTIGTLQKDVKDNAKDSIISAFSLEYENSSQTPPVRLSYTGSGVYRDNV